MRQGSKSARVCAITRFLVVSALAVWPLTARAQDHPLRGVALVIGESKYAELPALSNPQKDARDIDRLLGDLGFDVDRVLNADGDELRQAISQFEESAKDADVALVYYSGHGIEAEGENFIVPIDTDISSPEKAGAGLIAVQPVLEALAKVVPVSIVLLDACRSDPFPTGTMVQLPGETTLVPVSSEGLAAVKGPKPVAMKNLDPDSLGSVIGFAAEPGAPALDGPPGENSPYASALLKHFAAGGYSFADVMTMVSEEVYLKTKAKQLPWVNSSLRRVLTFGGSADSRNADEKAITDGRRQLLLSIANASDVKRTTVERIATSEDVSLDALYGMLKVLGVDTSKGSVDLEQQLQEGARQLKSFKEQELGAGAADAELARLADLANRAQDEGAMDLALRYREQATSRARTLSAERDNLEGRLKVDRLAFGATFAEHAQTAILNFDYATAAEMFGEAFGQVARWDDGKAIEYKIAEADSFRNDGDFRADNDALRRAISTYQEALALSPSYEKWLLVENNLGWALQTLGARNLDTAMLDQAATTFNLVLDARKKSDAPFNWAITAVNLGNVLTDLGKRDPTNDRLEKAVTVLKHVLDTTQRDQDPFTWGRAELDLGVALEELGLRDTGNVRLEQSIVELNSALSALPRETAPLDWANALNTRGNAFYMMAERDGDPATFSRARDDFNEALKERTQTRVPLDWAMTKSNLANTIVALAAITGDPRELPDAISAYRSTLTVLTIDTVPLLYASAQTNLAVTLATLGQANGDTWMVQDAVDTFAEALKARTEESDPFNWAMTEFDLASALQYLGTRTGNAENMQQAEDATNAALRKWTRDKLPLDWARAQLRLGQILEAASSVEQDADKLEASVVALRNALGVLTREAHLKEWLVAESTLGDALALRGTREDGIASLRESVEAYREALSGTQLRPKGLPFGETQFNLGLALLTLDARGDPAALAEAGDAFTAALEVFTAIGFPMNFADTQRHLGLVHAQLASKDKGTDDILAAASAFGAALGAVSKTNNPLIWAELEDDLGLMYEMLGQRTQDLAALQRGRAAVAEAWDVVKAHDSSHDEDFAGQLAGFDQEIAGLL